MIRLLPLRLGLRLRRAVRRPEPRVSAERARPAGGDPQGVDEPVLGCDGAACDGVSPQCPETCDLGGCVAGLACVDGACEEVSP